MGVLWGYYGDIMGILWGTIVNLEELLHNFIGFNQEFLGHDGDHQEYLGYYGDLTFNQESLRKLCGY